MKRRVDELRRDRGRKTKHLKLVLNEVITQERGSLWEADRKEVQEVGLADRRMDENLICMGTRGRGEEKREEERDKFTCYS